MAIKTHGIASIEYAEGIILVVRNPYDAILADFNRQASGSHTGTATAADFAESSMWQTFLPGHIKRWSASHLFYGEYANVTYIPIHVMYFEDLKSNVKEQIDQLVHFYKDKFQFEPKELEWRMECLAKA